VRYAKGALVITPARDIPLLRQVRNSRFIGHGQLFQILQHDCYGSCRSTFNWRVHRLLKTRHISRLDGFSWQGAPVYSITANGLMELESQGEFAIALHSETRHMPHRVQVFHSLELNAIRMALAQNALLAGWRSEIEISSHNMISSTPLQKDYDAIIRLWSGNELLEFALEYERSLKSAKQYARIRTALECERQVGCVLYLTASPDLLLALLYQLTPLAKPVAFATARAFRENLLATAVTTGAAGGMLSFDNFLREARADGALREALLRSS
jgi:hypothetical protein